MFDHNTEVFYHWSETYQTNLSSWNVLCLIRFPKLVFKFCSKQWIQLRYWLLYLNRSEEILSIDGLLWPMVSFLSFRQSTEPVLVSYVSRQDSGSSSSPESVTDFSSDPCNLLQRCLQYSSVGHSSSGFTFPLPSCDKSQTNTQHYLVK